MKKTVNRLCDASETYYRYGIEKMSNKEYDQLFDMLVEEEMRTGIVLPNSPTQHPGSKEDSFLKKEKHFKPMLSLDKTKDSGAFKNFLSDEIGILSFKLDGLTIVLTYNGGKLIKAVTRGDGIEGENITNTAKRIHNLPLEINYKKKLIIRGEAVISYSDFKKNCSNVYKNPRNLCAGTIRGYDCDLVAKRGVQFIFFQLVYADLDFNNSHMNEFDWIESLGFSVVPHVPVNNNTLFDEMDRFTNEIRNKSIDVPCDGLVLLLDDITYGESLGATARFPHNAMAFKWNDDVEETTLRSVSWNVTRTGEIVPVAEFDPIDILNTEVSRAYLHNLSVIEQLQLGIGDRITVYKANMIIPQICEDLDKTGTIDIPKTCPVCGAPTVIKMTTGTKVLRCENPKCPAKILGVLELFVSKKGMNITGLSKKSLTRLVADGCIHDAIDIYHLVDYKEKYNSRWFDNIIASVEKSRSAKIEFFLCALGIPGVGEAAASKIVKYFGRDINKIMDASVEELIDIPGIQEDKARKIKLYFRINKKKLRELVGELNLL